MNKKKVLKDFNQNCEFLIDNIIFFTLKHRHFIEILVPMRCNPRLKYKNLLPYLKTWCIYSHEMQVNRIEEILWDGAAMISRYICIAFRYLPNNNIERTVNLFLNLNLYAYGSNHGIAINCMKQARKL